MAYIITLVSFLLMSREKQVGGCIVYPMVVTLLLAIFLYRSTVMNTVKTMMELAKFCIKVVRDGGEVRVHSTEAGFIIRRRIDKGKEGGVMVVEYTEAGMISRKMDKEEEKDIGEEKLHFVFKEF